MENKITRLALFLHETRLFHTLIVYNKRYKSPLAELQGTSHIISLYGGKVTRRLGHRLKRDTLHV